MIERHGRIDVLFNNAGVFIPGTVVDMADDDWDTVLSVNLRSVFLVSKHVVPQMVTQGKGAIVNNASIAAVVGDVNGAAYCASKGGVGQLTRAMALDHAKQGIRVNAVCCAEIDTPLFEREAVQIGMTGRGVPADPRRSTSDRAHRTPRRRSPRRWPSSPATTPASSPAPCSTSTAGTRRSESRLDGVSQGLTAFRGA